MFSPRHQPAALVARRFAGVRQFALSFLERMHPLCGAERRD
jgi:hypothetical protein